MTDVDGELLDRLHKLFLDHRGPDNAISSGQIGETLGIEDAEGNPDTREAIRVLCDERGVPIASGGNGYYVIENKSQLKKYLSSLDGRIAGIQERKQIVVDAWDGHLETQAAAGGSE